MKGKQVKEEKKTRENTKEMANSEKNEIGKRVLKHTHGLVRHWEISGIQEIYNLD